MEGVVECFWRCITVDCGEYLVLSASSSTLVRAVLFLFLLHSPRLSLISNQRPAHRFTLSLTNSTFSLPFFTLSPSSQTSLRNFSKPSLNIHSGTPVPSKPPAFNVPACCAPSSSSPNALSSCGNKPGFANAREEASLSFSDGPPARRSASREAIFASVAGLGEEGGEGGMDRLGNGGRVRFRIWVCGDGGVEGREVSRADVGAGAGPRRGLESGRRSASEVAEGGKGTAVVIDSSTCESRIGRPFRSGGAIVSAIRMIN